MTEQNTHWPLHSVPDRRSLLVLALFVGSGCAALIYEIVWLQLLQLIVGSSAASLGVLLGTFMGGMCVGSLALPRLIGPHHHPLRVYACLELGIGVFGILVLWGLPYLNDLYAVAAAQGIRGFLLRGLMAAVCLLPPTILMGATLSAVARWVEMTPRGVSWLGIFYGGNIAGAVIGCLLAGFYLLRVHDVAIASYVAVAINLSVAILSLRLAKQSPHVVSRGEPSDRPTQTVTNSWSIYLAIGLSGLGALGAEVIWTRLLSLIIGGTVYTFAIILAVFLTGLGIGSTIGAVVSRRTSPRLAFGVCQLLLAAAIAWATHQLATSLPYWPIDPSLLHNPWHGFQLDLVRCLWAVLPAAMLWGASFPLALGAISTRRDDPGKLVGRLYAANTLGAIIGSLSFSMIVVAWIGTQRAQQILIALAVCSALLALAPIVFSNRSVRDPTPNHAISRRGLRTVLLGGAIAVAIWLAWTLPPVPGELIANGRYLPQRANLDKILYQGEGVNASVAVSLGPDQVRSFHVSGKIEASSSTQDMRLQRLLGHIPALMHPQPRSVLVVGCGAGVTAGSFLLHPDVERVVICEIEPLIPQVVAQYFSDENYNVVTDPRVEVVYDDARHFVLTTHEKFDVVTSDPIHPWVKGAATLYTQEYFELCKQRLNPGGVITQWVPLYESNAETVKSELATFSEVFPDSTIWSNDQDGQGYDVVVLGQVGPLKIDIEAFANRLKRDDHALVALSLAEVGFHSSNDLLATYAGAAADLKLWLVDAEINRDRNLRLQFIAGMSATYYHEWFIYDEILRYRRYPENLFHVSPAAQPDLKRRLRLSEPQP